MTGCNITPLATKACSGKCRGDTCKPNDTHVWVLATCEGMAALFQKQLDGHLRPVSKQGRHVLSFADGLVDYLDNACDRSEFKQLVLVGSPNDLSWTQASLPPNVSKHIVAEIKYPLMSGWFKQESPASHLTQAIEHLFRN